MALVLTDNIIVCNLSNKNEFVYLLLLFNKVKVFPIRLLD